MSRRSLGSQLFGTLRGRLVVSVAFVHAVMMTLFVADLTSRQRAMLLEQQSLHAEQLARTLAASAAGWLASGDVSGLQELADEQRRDPDVTFVVLADADGRVIAHTDRSRRGQFLLDLPATAREPVTILRSTSLTDVAAPSMLGDARVGWVRVGIGQREGASRLASITRAGLLYALAAIAVGSLIAWFMGRRITRRLYLVQETIRRVKSGDVRARANASGSDETASIAGEFDHMLDVLAERDGALEQRDRHARSLLRLSRSLEQARTIADALDATRVEIEGVVGYRNVWIYLSGPDRDTLRLITVSGGLPNSLEQDPEVATLSTKGDRMLQEIAAADHVVIVEDARTDPRTDKAMVAHMDNRSIVNVPLLLHDRKLGSLGMGTFGDEGVRVPTENENEYLTTLASHLGVTLDRLRLAAERDAAADEARLLGFALDRGRESVYLIDERAHLRFANLEASRFLGYEHDELLRLTIGQLDPDFPMEHWDTHWRNLRERGSITIETRHRTKDGSFVPVEVVANYFEYQGEGFNLALARDVRERRQAEETLRRTNRELRAITDCNETLIRAEDEDALLHDVCRIICEQAGYKMAWVGYAESDAEKTVRPAAWFGIGVDAFGLHGVTWGDGPRGQGPAGTAIRTGVLQFFEDVSTDPRTEPWREEAIRHGYRSVVSLPLTTSEGATIGALTLLSDQPVAFTAEEQRLLQELAGDLAFGIGVLRARGHQREAEAELLASEARYRGLVENLPDFVVRFGTDLRRTYVNPAWERSTGLSASEAIAVPIEQLPRVPAPVVKSYREALERALANGTREQVQFDWVNARGETLWLDYVIVPERAPDGSVKGLLAVGRDVTERKRAEESLRRLNRELRAVSECNQALIRAEDEDALLAEICQIICEQAGYEMAWVGYPEHDEARRIRIVARAGRDEGFLAHAGVVWADVPRGHGSAGTAIRSGLASLVDDFALDPRVEPWREAALSRGLRSSVGLPLKRADESVFGVLVIYSSRPGAFDAGEVRLLEELASDLAFGIRVLRTRKELAVAARERQQHLRFLEGMDRINRALQESGDLAHALDRVLDATLDIFGADRAYLLHPCDPDAPTWQTPFERTRPEWPGVLELGLVMPMSEEVASTLRTLLVSDGPVVFGPGTEHPIPADTAERFEIRGLMAIVLRPMTGKPWQFGLHQCTHERDWSSDDQRLLREIARRLEDGLTSILTRQQLVESEVRYREVFENSPVAIWEQDWSQVKAMIQRLAREGVTDIEAHLARRPQIARECVEAIRIVDMNRAALAIHGATSKDELRAHLDDVFTPEFLETSKRVLTCLWYGGTQQHADTTLRTLSGELRQVAAGFTVFPGAEDTLARVVVSYHDVTQHRLAEEERGRLRAQLTQAQKMEAIGQLAGGVAHDFNNVLTVFAGYGELLSHATADAKLKSYADVIVDTTRKASGLTQSLLAFSRNQALAMRHIDLNEAVGRVGKLLRRLIGEDIELGIECSAQPLDVLADTGQIEQVLMNLATNARDAMPGGGHLVIRTDAVTLDESAVASGEVKQAGRYARLTVTDDGCGMSRSTMDRIFEPFFTTKVVGKGTGLGLAIIYGIVKQHEGTIRVESELDHGTTFSVYLPLASSEATPDEAPLPPPAGGTETLLVAEDDATLRNVVKLMLEKAGYRVLEAADGSEAVTLVQQYADEIGLVLTDVVMPKKNGREVREIVASIAPHVPVLLMSGYTADVVGLHGGDGEDLPLVRKPLVFDELKRRVRAMLDAAGNPTA